MAGNHTKPHTTTHSHRTLRAKPQHTHPIPNHTTLLHHSLGSMAKKPLTMAQNTNHLPITHHGNLILQRSNDMIESTIGYWIGKAIIIFIVIYAVNSWIDKKDKQYDIPISKK